MSHLLRLSFRLPPLTALSTMKRFTLHFRPALLDSLKTYRRQDLMAMWAPG